MAATRDAIVVGAGVAGAATAWCLAREGYDVTLVERVEPGAGASGRNPGFLWLQTKTPGPQMDLALAGRRFMETLSDSIEDFGFRACGGLIAIRDESLRQAGRAFAADRKAAGLPVAFLEREEVREHVPGIGDQVIAGVWNPLDAHQDTQRLVTALVTAAAGDGAELRCGATVAGLEEHGGHVQGVHFGDGTRLGADLVVLANAIDANTLLDPWSLNVPMTPVRYEALETAAADIRVDPVICGQSLFGHFDFIRDLVDASDALPTAHDPLFPELGFTEQIAQCADGRFQLGCAVTVGTTDDRPTLAGLGLAGTVIARNLPALARLPVQRTWAGIVAQAPDYLPVIAADYGLQGLALNTGHAFGNVAGALSGALLTDLIAGRRPQLDMSAYAPDRFAHHNRPGQRD